MKLKLRNLLLYFIYWLFFFQFGRLLFFTFTKAHSTQFSISVLGEAMLHALWLDASVAGYYNLFFGLMLVAGIFAPKRFQKIFFIFHGIILGISCLAIICNAVLYVYWSGPLDYNAIKYLQHPAEAAASINWFLMIIPILCGIILFVAFQYLFKRLQFGCFENIPKTHPTKIIQTCVLLFFTVTMIIPIRGGFGIVPVNLSFVYFSKDIYPNHAAYNPVWNVIYSWTTTRTENEYSFMGDKEAAKKFQSLYQTIKTEKENERWISTSKPNIIIIALESYMAKLVNLKYRGEEVIPNFNRLSKQGIYFNRLYASGDRSDKGLVSIFSGYPAMPKSSLVQFPEMFQNIPSLFKDFENQGYSTAFYYGGNLDFANLRSYFISSGVQKIVTGEDLSSKFKRGKWGVHDEVMFDEFFKGIETMKQPFLRSFFTLSNHEPYDLPQSGHFGHQSLDEEYMSGAYYTDKYLGLFMESLHKSALWENTLVILVADHGIPKLGVQDIFDPEKYHIPMVWTGGVIKTPLVFEKICSQTDIPLAILNQCCIKPLKPYKYSNPIENPGSKEFAIYYYNDGEGIVTKNDIVIFDNVSQQYQNKYSNNDSIGKYAKAYLQTISLDFKRK